MATRCLFGIFVLKSDSIVYRFVTDDLYAHLMECFKNRGYRLSDDLDEDNQADDNNDTELNLTVDDAIAQHLAMLNRVLDQTSLRHDPIRRITLQTGIQVFFDQIAESNLLCMADKSFDTIVVLKTINLFKALIKFHIGALPFIYYNVADQLINRISASLQYFLNNITTNQALLFESSEHLHMNSLTVREKCNETCSIISTDIQNLIKVPRKIILITCNDIVVHMYMSPDQSRPNNADLFLLLLNNTSRPLRKEFVSKTKKASVMAHKYQRTRNNNQNHSVPNSARTSADTNFFSATTTDRSNSCPNFSSTEFTASSEKAERIHRSEVVFLRTANKVIAPFTLFTIPLIDNISALILLEWDNSTICSSLYELIRHLDSCCTHAMFPYSTLNPQVKAVESNAAVRRYFEQNGSSVSVLTDIFNKAHALHKASSRGNIDTNQKHQNGLRIINYLSQMSLFATEAYRHLFFDDDEYARRSGSGTEKDEPADIQMDGVDSTETKLRRNEYDTSPMTKLLRQKILSELEDCFSFISVKSQRNITMSLFVEKSFNNQNDFPGLVHFAFIDRLHGRILTPTLINNNQQHYFNPDFENIFEKKILAFELECHSALQQGFTSYTMSDEHFTYNYTLRLQESNGASMRLYKSFVQSHPPSVLHVDFYKILAEEYYPWLAYQTSVACYELISVHLRILPPHIVREQCQRLWPKLMEPVE